MRHNDRFTVINIREYLKNAGDEEQLGEDVLRQILSEFSCGKNQDVEYFLKTQAINFTNKNQSVTYLVFASEDAQLLGYFTLTIKPITVSDEPFSNTARKKLSRVSILNEKEHTYSLAAYLNFMQVHLIKSESYNSFCSLCSIAPALELRTYAVLYLRKMIFAVNEEICYLTDAFTAFLADNRPAVVVLTGIVSDVFVKKSLCLLHCRVRRLGIHHLDLLVRRPVLKDRIAVAVFKAPEYEPFRLYRLCSCMCKHCFPPQISIP